MEGSLIWLIVIIFAWSYFHIIIHEAGHALVGNWLGYNVRLVIIGNNKKLFAIKLGRVLIEFRLLPRGGLTQGMTFPLQGKQWKQVLYSAAGITANTLTVLLIAVYFFSREEAPSSLMKLAFYVIVIKETISIAVNLWPHEVDDCRGMKIPTDGKQILMALKGKKLPPNLAIMQNHLADLYRYDKAVSEDALQIHKQSVEDLNTICYCFLNIHDGNLNEAMRLYTEKIAKMPLMPVEKAWICDHLASLTRRNNRTDFFETCVSMMEHWVKVFPDAKTLHSTLGGLQIELGRYHDGLQTLLPITNPKSDHIDRAISSLYVAKAYRALGNEESAQKFIEIRKRVPFEDQMTKKLEKEIAASVIA